MSEESVQWRRKKKKAALYGRALVVGLHVEEGHEEKNNTDMQTDTEIDKYCKFIGQ